MVMALEHNLFCPLALEDISLFGKIIRNYSSWKFLRFVKCLIFLVIKYKKECVSPTYIAE